MCARLCWVISVSSSACLCILTNFNPEQAKCQWTYVSEATASILIGYFAGYFISRTSTYTIASLGDKGFFLCTSVSFDFIFLFLQML
jgi:hypothetical protein